MLPHQSEHTYNDFTSSKHAVPRHHVASSESNGNGSGSPISPLDNDKWTTCVGAFTTLRNSTWTQVEHKHGLDQHADFLGGLIDAHERIGHRSVLLRLQAARSCTCIPSVMQNGLAEYRSQRF